MRTVSLLMSKFSLVRITYSMSQEELDIFAEYIELLAVIDETDYEDV